MHKISPKPQVKMAIALAARTRRNGGSGFACLTRLSQSRVHRPIRRAKGLPALYFQCSTSGDPSD
jgi:hypothetical protein